MVSEPQSQLNSETSPSFIRIQPTSVCPRSELIEYEVYPDGVNNLTELAYHLYGAGRALFQRKLAVGDLPIASVGSA